MNKDGIRIEKIKSDHAELLRRVRDSIVENHGILKEEIEEVVQVLDFDEKSIKKYEATLNAQELVTTLTKEILEAKTKEEVFEIRKKLNYYMNKIKAEIKRRELDESYLNDYQIKVTYLRKDIAKYIRFLKREDNIAEIDRLYSDYENLTQEEMTNLKKALSREVSYNRRNLAESKEEVVTEEKSIEKEISTEVVEKDLTKSFDIRENDNPFRLTISDDGLQEANFHLKEVPQRPGNQYITQDIQTASYAEVEKYLSGKVSDYNRRYRVRQTYDYSKTHLGKNMVNFFKNLPLYVHNKKAIKRMKNDYYRFYNGHDLGSYIEYLKRRNSIANGLKCMFSRTHLFNNNDIIKHEKCTMWLYEFCIRHHLDLSFQNQRERSL